MAWNAERSRASTLAHAAVSLLWQAVRRLTLFAFLTIVENEKLVSLHDSFCRPNLEPILEPTTTFYGTNR
jgi:hypothetical protein